MKLTISKGNLKLGSVPNISLPPGASCPSGVPCFGEGCYAMKAYHQYPAVRKAWDGNLELWNEGPIEFIYQLDKYLQKENPERFRWHVGGDIPNKDYLEMMEEIADEFDQTSYLCFTKRYELDYILPPPNLNIVLSAWPGLELVNPYNLPVAWLAEDPRAPLNDVHVRCPGKCDGVCQYKCWGTKLDIVFDKH